MTLITDIPTELIAEVIGNLTVNDTRSLARAALLSPNGVTITCECRSRLSITGYLLRDTGHGEDLLSLMDKYMVYISGSRALNFFVPGCTDVDSDWDFYVPTSNVRPFMTSLSSMMGVVWDPDTDIPNFTDDIVYSLRSCRGVHNGMIGTRQRSTKIQVILERRSNISKPAAVLEFCHSAVQCIITAHGACHLYGKLANEGTSIAWSYVEPGTTDQQSMNKYAKRGYRFIEHKARTPARYRSATDADATVVLRDDRAPATSKARHPNGMLSKLDWTEPRPSKYRYVMFPGREPRCAPRNLSPIVDNLSGLLHSLGVSENYGL